MRPFSLKTLKKGQRWCHMPLFATWRQKQADFCEFDGSLDYTVSDYTARATQ